MTRSDIQIEVGVVYYSLLDIIEVIERHAYLERSALNQGTILDCSLEERMQWYIKGLENAVDIVANIGQYIPVDRMSDNDYLDRGRIENTSGVDRVINQHKYILRE